MSQEWSAQGAVSRALRAVIADFGSQVLGNPDMLGNLLKDHIPDHPREINVLQAAAQSGAAAAVDDRIRSGMAPAAAVRMTAAELTNSLAIDPAAAEWGVTEFAQVLGYTIEPTSAAPPQPDVTWRTAAQPADQQFGATIAAPIPPYAGPPPGYPQPQLQQQFYAPPPQPAPAGSKSRRPLIVAVCAVVVIAAAVGGILALKSSPAQLTAAQCLVGTWNLQSGQDIVASGSGSGTWTFTGGTDVWTYGSGGTGRVADSHFANTNSSSTKSDVYNAAGTFRYHVVGKLIKYNSVHVPGSLTIENLTAGTQQKFSYKSLYNAAPDEFSCSGNRLRRYGSSSGYTYSYIYARQST